MSWNAASYHSLQNKRYRLTIVFYSGQVGYFLPGIGSSIYFLKEAAISALNSRVCPNATLCMPEDISTAYSEYATCF